MTDGSSASSLLVSLDDGLVLLIGIYLDARSFGRLLQTCRQFSQLMTGGNQKFENGNDYLWQLRVEEHYGPFHTVSVPSSDNDHDLPPWQRLACDLHCGYGTYYGFCLDAFTAGFEPYPMKFTYYPSSSCTNNNNNGMTDYTARLYWKTLRQSITRVFVTQSVRDTNKNSSHHHQKQQGFLESMSFSEVELLRGGNILIPNRYQGFWATPGKQMIGVFPNGCFFFIRSEALSDEHLETSMGWSLVEEQHGDDVDVVVPRRMTLSASPAAGCACPTPKQQQNTATAIISAGAILEGIATMELVDFDPRQIIRAPLPRCCHLRLKIQSQRQDVGDFPSFGIPSSVMELTKHPQVEIFRGTLMFWSDSSNSNNDQTKTSSSSASTEPPPTKQGVNVIFVTKIPNQMYDTLMVPFGFAKRVKNEDNKSNNVSFSPNVTKDDAAFARFMLNSLLYGWSNPPRGNNSGRQSGGGNDDDEGEEYYSMIGLQKDRLTHRTGSFCLQLRPGAASSSSGNRSHMRLKEMVQRVSALSSTMM